MSSLEYLADRLMQILPADGSQMLNDDALMLLGRELEAAVDSQPRR